MNLLTYPPDLLSSAPLGMARTGSTYFRPFGNCSSVDIYQSFRKRRAAIWVSSFTCSGLLVVLFLERVSILKFAAATNEAHRTSWLSRLLLQLPYHQLLFVGGRVPWLARASSSFALVGLVTAVFTIWALLLLEHTNLRIPARVAGWIRIVADSTFALYLLHLPLLIFIVSVMGKPIEGWWRTSMVLGLIIVGCVAFALPLDALKRDMRFRMQRAKWALWAGKPI